MPQLMEDREEMVQVSVQESISERIVEQVGDVAMPEMLEEIVVTLCVAFFL